MPLVITPGAEDANSYADTDTAADYFDTTPRAARWTALIAAAGDDGEAALLQAMVFLEEMKFLGLRADEDQALEFPRYGGARRTLRQSISSDELRDRRGRTWAADAIPAPIHNAQCELALTLGENTSWSSATAPYKKVLIKTGSTEIEMGPGADVSGAALLKNNSLVASLLAPFLLDPGSVH